MGPEIQYALILLRGHLERARDDERGVSTLELVIITGVIVIVSAAVAALIFNRIQNRANSINI